MSVRPDLNDVFREAQSLIPILEGEIGACETGWIMPGRDNSAPLIELYRTIRANAPEAGPAFWSTSLWNHLNWQPLVITLLGVHRFSLLPDVSVLAQKVGPLGVAGVRLGAPHLRRGQPDDLIAEAGKNLRMYFDALAAEQRSTARHFERSEFSCVKPITARRLLADRLLSLVVRINGRTGAADNEPLQAIATKWIAALSLEGMSALVPIRLSNGREKLVLNRRACCMTYLRNDHEVCPSCPTQQSRAERLRRLVAYWDAHDC